MGSDAAEAPGGQQAAVAPDPVPTQVLSPPDDPAPVTITDDVTPAPPVPARPISKPRPTPATNAGSKLPTLPGRGPASGGRPTGASDGFSDRVRQGDAWATEVLAALGQAPVGTFGGALPGGTLRFQLSVCPNGTIRGFKQTRSGSTMDPAGADRVALALGNVRVPRPPAEMRTAMGGACKRLDYTFAWTAAGVQ